ncbi:MAG: hypothetical protein EOP56_13625 [Sphingobacteriales bacterium]|nr:MAG: hypothetical protein EOP56_13625 [Sphingobacteriales bacterium]
MGLLDDLFKTKEGGTIAGNALDGIINGLSDGHINGIPNRRAGESEADYKARIAAALGASVQTFGQTAQTTNAKGFQAGFAQAKISTVLGTTLAVGLGAATLFGIFKLFKK